MELGEKVIKCQTEEARPDCVNRKFLEKVLASCHCSPLHLYQYFPEKVHIFL